jgi:hypothetical protein
MSPPNCKTGLERKYDIDDMVTKDTHCIEHNSVLPRPHFGRVACRIGLWDHLYPTQRSLVCCEELNVGFVKVGDVGADEGSENKKDMGKVERALRS